MCLSPGAALCVPPHSHAVLHLRHHRNAGGLEPQARKEKNFLIIALSGCIKKNFLWRQGDDERERVSDGGNSRQRSVLGWGGGGRADGV